MRGLLLDALLVVLLWLLFIACVVIVGKHNTVDTNPEIKSDQKLIELKTDSIK